ncbi:unnamed protein product, partial [Symbiodinium sp. KB8]
ESSVAGRTFGQCRSVVAGRRSGRDAGLVAIRARRGALHFFSQQDSSTVRPSRHHLLRHDAVLSCLRRWLL